MDPYNRVSKKKKERKEKRKTKGKNYHNLKAKEVLEMIV